MSSVDAAARAAQAASGKGAGQERPRAGNAASSAQKNGFALPDKAALLGLHRTMVLSRRLDDREIELKKRNEIYFQISGAGHEAINVAVGYLLKPAHDWFYPYYRDRALMLQLGMTAAEVLYEAVGAEEDPNSHGRQMPCHWGDRRTNVVSQSSPTGTQFLQAVGCAQAGRYIGGRGLNLPAKADEIVHCSSGDGTTNQGDFHEALSQACIDNLPVLFIIEDNGYAISVPSERHTPGGDIAAMVSGYAGLTTLKVDGRDLIACLEALAPVIAKMRSREIGPVLVVASVTRPYSHSLSDDHAMYRPKAELDAEAASDCLNISRQRLIKEFGVTEAEVSAVEKEADEEARDASRKAIAAAKPDPADAMVGLYATENSPADESIYGRQEAAQDGQPLSMGQAINRTLLTEMARDPRIRIFGQDVADASRESVLAECKGKGGVFKLTAGLQREHGHERCYNSPLAESKIVGTAVGQATRGLKPVPEIQFFDYIWTAMMQIRNEVATMRYRSRGDWTSSLVMRVPIGGYLKGGSIYHSQTGESIFAHCPGLRVVYPSTADDAAGLLRTAIRCDDPVMFLEHKRLYYEGANRAPWPGDDYTVPFGKARIRRSGSDLTVISWGALVQRCLDAAGTLSREGVAEAEVIDLRSINPLDEDAIFASVRKTGKAIIVAEENVFAGFGGEIAARIASDCFEWLDAPVRRVGSLDTWVAYSPILEDAILPQTKDVETALRSLAAY